MYTGHAHFNTENTYVPVPNIYTVGVLHCTVQIFELVYKNRKDSTSLTKPKLLIHAAKTR